MKEELVSQQWEIIDERGVIWEISFSKFRSRESKFVLTNKSLGCRYFACNQYSECLDYIRLHNVPPFVELTLKDIRKVSADYNTVVYKTVCDNFRFSMIFDEMKFSLLGMKYDSASEVLAVINEELRKGYGAYK